MPKLFQIGEYVIFFLSLIHIYKEKVEYLLFRYSTFNCFTDTPPKGLPFVFPQNKQCAGKKEQPFFLSLIHILFNQKGQLLIQQRQLHKAGYPGLWDVTAAGSALSLIHI